MAHVCNSSPWSLIQEYFLEFKASLVYTVWPYLKKIWLQWITQYRDANFNFAFQFIWVVQTFKLIFFVSFALIDLYFVLFRIISSVQNVLTLLSNTYAKLQNHLKTTIYRTSYLFWVYIIKFLLLLDSIVYITFQYIVYYILLFLLSGISLSLHWHPVKISTMFKKTHMIKLTENALQTRNSYWNHSHCNFSHLKRKN